MRENVALKYMYRLRLSSKLIYYKKTALLEEELNDFLLLFFGNCPESSTIHRILARDIVILIF